jgi:hypothetical protein
MIRPPAPPDQTGTPNWQIIAASAAGFVLVLLLLAIAVLKDNIPGPNFKIIWAILAIGCAAFAAIVPGFLEVRYKRWLQASGAIAVFALIYFNQPPVDRDPDPGPLPTASATEAALQWLRIMDEEKYSEAWNMLSRASQQMWPKPDFVGMSNQLRKPFGSAQSRVLIDMTAASQLPTGERGHFSGATYRTKVANGSEILELIVLQGKNTAWEPYSYRLWPANQMPPAGNGGTMPAVPN